MTFRQAQKIARPLACFIALGLLVSLYVLPWFGKTMPGIEYIAALVSLIGIHQITRSVERCKDKS